MVILFLSNPCSFRLYVYLYMQQVGSCGYNQITHKGRKNTQNVIVINAAASQFAGEMQQGAKQMIGGAQAMLHGMMFDEQAKIDHANTLQMR